MKISRRSFLASTFAVSASVALPKGQAHASVSSDSWASLIDLNKCDGCVGLEMPACVSSCRENRGAEFPEPAPEQLLDYKPQTKHEDWSQKRHLFDRLTPYNWIFVQKVEVDGQVVHIPRRCMHCDNPPCAKLCPIGVKHKTPEGPVYIDHSLCFGGAKCRDVCPWSIPQRQAGLGIYTLWQSWLPVGGGVMYKCDLCRDRLAQSEIPFCMDSCPKKAMTLGPRNEIFAKAEQMQAAGSHVYGLNENGGTSTLYVSSIAFEKIDEALVKQGDAKKQKQITRMHAAPNVLEKQTGWAVLGLAAPVVGILGALSLTKKWGKK